MSDYKKYFGGKSLYNSIIKAVPKMTVGAFAFAKLMRSKKKTHYLFCPPAMGDSILALSYLSEFKKQRGIDHVTVVCTPSIKRLCDYYANTVDDVVCMERWKINSVREFIETKIGRYYSMLNIDRCTFAFFNCIVSVRTLWDNHIIDYPMYAKAMIYKISLSAKPERPRIPKMDIVDLINRYELKKGGTVFLNPTTNSVRCDVSKLLVDVAAELTAKGYKVVTLTAKDDEAPVQGTPAITCGLETAFALVEFGGTLIGVRSGFFDVMAYANCRIITLDDEGHGFTSFFSLEKLGVNPDCHMVVYDGNEQAALIKIKEVFKRN